MELKIRRFIRLHKTLVVYSVLLIAGILSLLIGLIPAIQNSFTLVADLQTMRADIIRIQKKASMLDSLNQADLEQNAKEVIAAVPSDKSIATLLSTIEAVATKNNMYISDMSIEGIASLATGSAKSAMKAEGNSLTETISLQGELIQLRNFLADCIRVRRLMRIRDVALTSMPKTNLITAKLVVEVFYLPLPLSIGKPSDSLEPFTQQELSTIEKLQLYPIVYASDISVSPVQTTPVVTEIPTTPAVLDPFAPLRSATYTTPTPSPVIIITPKQTPSASPSTTPRVSPGPTSPATPSPTL